MNKENNMAWTQVRLSRKLVKVLNVLAQKNETYEDLLKKILIAGGFMTKDYTIHPDFERFVSPAKKK